ncbi:hypothetical protein Tcan_11451 [Toxocara canis]|uniref:Uncharacterized protein n=1 Tax=Toxocara canis TaxID=6265 RepID=A0A0B2VKZ3_TOXCA|nr:hypothetical protein Tcan_11451 [Toxocara canis]
MLYSQAHGINVRAVEGDNKENELISEGTVDCKKNVATMNGPYHDGVRPHGTHLTKRLVEQVSADDFSRIPHTTRARLDLASLNEVDLFS